MIKRIIAIGIFYLIAASPVTAQKTKPKASPPKAEPVPLKELAIGSDIPDSNLILPTVNFLPWVKIPLTFDNLRTANGLLVMFSCNTCPFVKKAEAHTKEMMLLTQEKKIGMVIINSNEAARKDGESEKDMAAYAAQNVYTVPYVLDIQSRLADDFGASHTPEVFLFNGEGKLVYRGAMEDNPSDLGVPTHFYIREAAELMLAHAHYDPEITKSLGCNIKRK